MSGLIGVVCLYALLATGCLESPAVTCKSGRLCAPGTVCDDTHNGCATPAQIAACAGKAQATACSYSGVADGACYEGVCLPGGCGNGVFDDGEVCEDGNRFHGDGCSADCRSEETCGNGVVDRFIADAEECDDGNNVDGDACHADCTVPTCGDGVKDVYDNEACDDGAANSNTIPDACRMNCQRHFCGDGVKDGDEVCDDGNGKSGDKCFYNCQSNETCDNGFLDFDVGEICDDGNRLHGDGCSGCQLETGTWRLAPATSPPPRQRPAMAYDTAHGKVVMFGGSSDVEAPLADTWEWNGSAWTNVTPASDNPPARIGAAMAYDASRGRVVLFGGNRDTGGGGFPLADTWEWNGSAWSNVTPASGNPPARAAVMAYDGARKKVVLFSSSSGTSVPAETWEWNGSAWSNVTPASGNPPARGGAAMAYDATRGQIVMFGGIGNGYLAETWTWNGIAWTNVTPGTSNPPGRSNATMVYDARDGAIVLFGGLSPDAGFFAADTWRWNGSTWSNVSPSSGNPPGRYVAGMAYDAARGNAVLFGGFDNAQTFADTWHWNGSAWSNATPVYGAPPARVVPAIGYDAGRGRVVLFGGFNGSTDFADTWEWNGSTWSNVTPASNNPPARSSAAMAYDASRGKVVLFGGAHTTSSETTIFDDTWEWDGSAWSHLTPASSPSARAGAAMAYDAARGKLVLFGGANSGWLADTWEWNGTTWSNVTPASGNPLAQSGATMVYDAARDKMVLFGGSGGTSADTGTWEWNGSAWSSVAPTSGNPPTRRKSTMAYDAARGNAVMFGGTSGPMTYFAETWEWNGSAWRNVTTAGKPTARDSAVMAFDIARGKVVLFGGFNAGVFADTWLYGYENGSGDEGCLYGLDGDDDDLIGCADPDCFGYCTPLCNPTLMTCDPAWPHCGDGMCQPIESERLCPSDCDPPVPMCGDFICDPAETTLSCPGDCS